MCAFTINLPELFKNNLLIFRANSNSSIGNGNANVAVFFRTMDADLATFWREFHCVT
jgi:hypothetical protein